MKKRMRIIDIASAVLILLLVIVMLYSGLQILESTVLRTGADEQGFVSRTITRDGVDPQDFLLHISYEANLR